MLIKILAFIGKSILCIAQFFGMIIKYIMIGMIQLYRHTISPWMPPICRFTPSCSQYFLEALQKKGLIKGTYLGVYRLLRCQPFCEGGYDPVDKEDDPNFPKETEKNKDNEEHVL